jgi:hypothetical protein
LLLVHLLFPSHVVILPIIFRILPTTYPTSLDLMSDPLPLPTAMFRHLPFHHIHRPPSPSTFTNRNVQPIEISPHSPYTFTINLHHQK